MDKFLGQPIAVVLAAGRGIRMHPLTDNRPKVMLPVAGKPMLEHLLIECREAGLSDFILVVGYLADQVKDYFGDGSILGINIRYTVQDQPIGTSNALGRAVSLLNGRPCLLVNGDVWLNRSEIMRLCQSTRITLSLVELEDVSDKGVVELDGGRIIRLHEKTTAPPTNLANAGVYFFTPDIYEVVDRTPRSKRGEFEITDTIQMVIDSGISVGYLLVKTWRELGYPWDLLAANEIVMESIDSKNDGCVEEGAVINGSVIIGTGSVIRAGSYVIGPVIIGNHCVLGPNCYIRPSTTIGNHCHIGAGVEIKNSIIMAETKIPHLTYVGDSVIGESCNLGAGTQVANLRLDKRQVLVNGRNTGRNKLGTIMGDRVSIGVNASINPGTIIGNGVFIRPGAVVAGNVVPGATASRT